MHHVIAMHMTDPLTELIHYLCCFLNPKLFTLIVFFHQLIAVPICTEFANQINIFLVVKVSINLNQIWMV